MQPSIVIVTVLQRKINPVLLLLLLLGFIQGVLHGLLLSIETESP